MVKKNKKKKTHLGHKVHRLIESMVGFEIIFKKILIYRLERKSNPAPPPPPP